MNEECLICKTPLTYLETDMMMECEICHKKETSKTRCVNGHYVCNECHIQGLDRIIELCMTSASRWKSRRSYAITPRKTISASESAVRFSR